MLYDELLQEFIASQAIPSENDKQRFDNTLAHLESLKKRDDLHYADYVLAVQDLGLNHNYEYVHRLIQLIRTRTMKKYLFILFQIDYDSPHDYADYLEPIIASSVKEYFSKIDTSELDGYENHLMIIDTDTNKEVKTILFSDNVSENIINAPENQNL